MPEFADHLSLQLAQRVDIGQIRAIAEWASSDTEHLQHLFSLINSPDDLTGRNALWCLTHCQKIDGRWLQSRQNELIDHLLTESNTSRRRMLLQLLRDQTYCKSCIRTDFLDFCLSRINSQCEPYAIRAFSIYCAYRMCRFYPEFLAELTEHLNLLATQPLSPGLRSALATTCRRIAKANQ